MDCSPDADQRGSSPESRAETGQIVVQLMRKSSPAGAREPSVPCHPPSPPQPVRRTPPVTTSDPSRGGRQSGGGGSVDTPSGRAANTKTASTSIEAT